MSFVFPKSNIMEYLHFIGIDVSKLSLSICVRIEKEELFYAEVENTPKEIKKFITILKRQRITFDNTLVCLEHTGVYGNHALETFHQKGFSLWLEHALNIKNSVRMTRGKNDTVDASRIAEYSVRFLDKLVFWEPTRDVIKGLKKLFSVRNILLKTKIQLSVSQNESVDYEDIKSSKLVGKYFKVVLKSIEQELEKVNVAIRTLIKKDEELNRLHKLVTSVPGMGEVSTWKVLAVTNEFKDFSNSRQFACYSGVVPFDYQSGTSIKGKPKVSNLANKEMKTLLHMAALSIVDQKKGELYEYYERKVEEGKNKMSVINALRNKIIGRVFACVKKNEPYQEIHLSQLV